MRRRSSLFAAVAGPRAKWLVFGVWFVVIVGSFAAGMPEKYTDAQENESTSFLPGDAESTKALTAAEDLQGGELAPAVILYRRESGLTAADKAKIVDDVGRLTAKRFPGVVADGATAAAGGAAADGRARSGAAGGRGLRRPDDADPGPAERLRAVRRPGVLRGRQGRARLRLRPRRRRRRDAAGPGAVLARDRLRSGRRPRGQDHRRRRLRGRRDRGLREHQRHAAARGDAARDRAADPDLPLADLPLHPARRGDLRRVPVADARLRAGRAGRDDQRPVERDHVDPRARRGHGLRAADRRPLPRGDAPREDKYAAMRAALVSAGPGRVRQRGDGDRGAVLPLARARERHVRPRPARRPRRVLRGAVDAHAAARAAADLRPPRVLAVRAAHARHATARGSSRRTGASCSPRSSVGALAQVVGACLVCLRPAAAHGPLGARAQALGRPRRRRSSRCSTGRSSRPTSCGASKHEHQVDATHGFWKRVGDRVAVNPRADLRRRRRDPARDVPRPGLLLDRPDHQRRLPRPRSSRSRARSCSPRASRPARARRRTSSSPTPPTSSACRPRSPTCRASRRSARRSRRATTGARCCRRR